MLRIATQNIRQPERGDRWRNRWSIRKQAHVHILNASRFHLVALQEMTKKTAKSFTNAVYKADENWVVTTPAYGNAVMYHSELVHTAGEAEIVEYEASSEKEKSGFTAYPFMELGTNTFFMFINTHLKDGDKGVRVAQAMQIMEYVQKLAKQNGVTVILAGDFNSIRTVQQVFRDNGLADLWEDEQDEPEAALNSYQGWTEAAGYKYEDEHVDGLFVKGNIIVVESGILPAVWNGVQASDHNTVWCDVILNQFEKDY